GGTHFQQLCDRRDILFLGAKVNLDELWHLPGGHKYGESVTVWQVQAEAINDYTKNMGYVFITGKPKVVEYSESQMDDMTMALRAVANKLHGDLADVFYSVHNAIIPWIDNPDGFNPFELNPIDIKTAGGADELSKKIDIVLREGPQRVDRSLWPEIKRYLEKLKNVLL
ncbi:MAG: hypothetical protein AAB740_03755, partial [Patescibacteria group bacterium]